MTLHPGWRVAIIGAGMTGASAAQALAREGATVTVFDKGRGPGGRCATRRQDVYSFDHGAQYFTARDPRFRKQVATWAKSGVAAHWRPRIGELSDGKFKPTQRNDLWVGTPGMNELSRAMLDGIDLRFQTQVGAIEQAADGWVIIDASSPRHIGFDQLLISVPATQVGALTGVLYPEASVAARNANMLPCWTLMLAFNKSIELPFDAAKVTGNRPISWLARNSTKPGRSDNATDCWVVQADHDWSREHVELTPKVATEELLGDFSRVCRECSVALTGPTHAAAHRWRYGLATPDNTQPCMVDGNMGLAVAGDWLSGGRIENAWLSGLAAAEALTTTRFEQAKTVSGA